MYGYSNIYIYIYTTFNLTKQFKTMMKLNGNLMCCVVDVGSVKDKHSQTSKYFNMNKILKCPGGIVVST